MRNPPAALQHIQPGRWMAILGGVAAYTAGVPDGTRTDSPQAADLHWAAHSTSPIPSLRSSAARRCDNCHEIVELDRDLGFGSHIEDRQAPTLTPPPAAGGRGMHRTQSRKRKKNPPQFFADISMSFSLWRKTQNYFWSTLVISRSLRVLSRSNVSS